MARRWINTLVIYDARGNVARREGYWYDGPIAEAVAMAAFDQDSYAFYNDDGSESAATIIGSANSQQTLTVDTIYHARILIQESGGASGNFNGSAWEYNRNAAGWVALTTTSTHIQIANSANLTDAQDTTQRIGAGTYITTNGWVSEDGTPGNLSFGASQECEAVAAITIVGSAVAHGDEILLRLSGADTYTRNADIDVNKPAAAGPPKGGRMMMGLGL